MENQRRDPLYLQGNDRYYMIRSPVTQRRPYVKPLPYYRVGGTSKVQRLGTETKLLPLKSGKMGTFGTEFLTSVAFVPDKDFVKAHNKALSKVDDQLRTADSFFEDWYERQQAVKLLASVGKSLFNFVTGWRNPRYWKGIAKDARPKDLPSAWLAYQFGVKPLVSGVDRALNLLSADFPIMNISGSSSQDVERTIPRMFGWGANYPQTNTCTGTALVKIGCRVTGINPNRALSGATGANEPFSSVWNVLPWGWAVDYFVNVGQLLGNMENRHPGITVTDWYTTSMLRMDVKSVPDYHGLRKKVSAPVYDSIVKQYAYVYDAKVYRMRRTVGGSPNYKLELKYPPLGGNKMANLFAAIALTMSGKKGK